MYRHVKDHTAMRYLATRPTMIITTRHGSGVVNAGVFGAYTILGPSQTGVAVGQTSHTRKNILRDGEFVINVPGADIVKSIRILADNIPESSSEVDEAGLTLKDPVNGNVPSIAECQAAVEFEFEREMPIDHHSFMIGKAVGGWIRESVLDDDGRINIFRAQVFKDFKYPEPVYVLPGDVIEG